VRFTESAHIMDYQKQKQQSKPDPAGGSQMGGQMALSEKLPAFFKRKL